ncbi:glycosyltransferase family 9 protein [Spiribacter pallidus]|uniref:glycosyltransferase family 9 protein n=1 Tax=Spiribacter pallidus TaxID=1987936 RepID=UPI0034A018C9
MPSQSAPQRICLMRLSAIGDCCNLVPMVRTLQRFCPQSKITWVMGRAESALLGDLDGVEVITHDKRSGAGGLRRQLKGRDFDALLLMQVALRAGLASRAVNARRRIGFDRSRSRDGHGFFINERISAQPRGHVIDGFFGFANALGIAEREMRWDVPVPEWASARAGAWRGDAAAPTLLISPCSSQRFRNYRDWPVTHYAEVARHAIEYHGMQVLITGTDNPRDHHYGRTLQDRLSPRPVINATGQTDLKTLFALIQQSTVVLAPDSGPIHMAVAAGTPVIGLYATSNPQRTGPVLGRHWVVNAYPQAVEQAFGRPVEALRWGRRVRDSKAMSLITTQSVCDRLDALMDTPPAERLV